MQELKAHICLPQQTLMEKVFGGSAVLVITLTPRITSTLTALLTAILPMFSPVSAQLYKSNNIW